MKREARQAAQRDGINDIMRLHKISLNRDSIESGVGNDGMK